MEPSKAQSNGSTTVVFLWILMCSNRLSCAINGTSANPGLSKNFYLFQLINQRLCKISNVMVTGRNMVRATLLKFPEGLSRIIDENENYHNSCENVKSSMYEISWFILRTILIQLSSMTIRKCSGKYSW